MPELQHAFLSYVREDAEAADRIQVALEGAGVKVWRDRDNLGPGDAWKTKIRDAIQQESLAFVALLSTNSLTKERSHQRPELLLAAEEYQLRPPERNWLFPVRLDDGSVPSLELGGGRYLTDLQWSDVFGDRAERDLIRLVLAVHQLLDTTAPVPVVTDIVLSTRTDDVPVMTSLKRLLRDDNADIELEDFLDDLTQPVAAALEDRTAFPVAFPPGSTNGSATRTAADMLRNWQQVLLPLQEAFVLAGTYARPSTDAVWTRTLETIARATTPARTGPIAPLLEHLQTFPLLRLETAISIAAVSRQNYSPLRAALIDAQTERDNTSGPVLAFTNSRTLFGEADWMASAVVTARGSNQELDDNYVRAFELRQSPARLTPVSDLLHDQLRSAFARELPTDARYTDAFDRACVLMDALALDLRSANTMHRYRPAYPSFGSYTWRYRHREDPIESIMLGELSSSSPMLQAGLFGGSFERASTAFTQLVESAGQVRNQHW